MEGVSTAKIVLFHQGRGVTRRLLGPHDTLPCALICTFTDKIRNSDLKSTSSFSSKSTSSFSSSCGKDKKIGFKSPKSGHRPALGYTNTKRSEI